VSIDTLRGPVRTLAQRSQDRIYNWMLSRAPVTVEDLQQNLFVLAGVYAQSAALIAADWYEEQDPDSRYAAFLDDDLPDEKLANMALWVFRGPQEPENRGRVAAHKLVFDAARRTIFANAATEGVAIARHESARCCNGCLVRATLTARDRNSSSEDVAQDFHPSCEGMFVPVRSGLYAPPEHTKEWRNRVLLARRAGNTALDDLAYWLDNH
jgi:hypothetical protein